MAIYVFLSGMGDDCSVVTIGDPLLDWFDGAVASVQRANPFARFDPYGSVTLSSSSGEVASFASALERLREALLAANAERLPPLPVLADENDPDSGELDLDDVLRVLSLTLEAAREADAHGGLIIAAGE